MTTGTTSSEKTRERRFQHWQVVAFFLLIYDLISLNAAYFLALWFRFDCRISQIEPEYWQAYLMFGVAYSVLAVLVYHFCGLYRSVWRFASFMEMERIVLGCLISFVIQAVGISICVSLVSDEYWRMPYSYYFMGFMMQFFFSMTARFSYRFFLLFKERHVSGRMEIHPVMVIGAGSAGRAIIREVNHLGGGNDRVVCIIDDDKNKWKRNIDGIPIIGGRDEIMAACSRYKIEKIYIAIPSATPGELKDILGVCKETDCALKLLRNMYQMVDEDRISVRDLKDVSIEDLLGRDPIRVDMKEIYESLSGRVIMVTGGGGSIGSELCRQVAKHEPKELIIFDIYENNAYEIQQELKRLHPDLKLTVLIGSVRDAGRLEYVFEKYRPEVVYHAAAHKHVPLMEESPHESIKNNVFGTYNTALMAKKYGCRRFVLISTDKAVNPTNIMGASKRLCEMVVQCFAKEEGETEFAAVRFGNVLGSNGSVVPLFREQIAQGGPVTVTHPDIIRYFMTIPEAVSLVLQAGSYAKGGEIFVLDMGSPVKIDTLARNLIRLSGLKPDEDIKISYTGLRPGEKMYEEKLMDEEGLQTTPNHLIHIGRPIEIDTEKFKAELEELKSAAFDEEGDIKSAVAKMVTTYKP
ncbi:MAG: polysaccharide biosynthesis protein [Lachnospiraceae bacterium]|nr:polysaccharide biosynthesis protein [Lachnospiraceae bacterium]